MNIIRTLLFAVLFAPAGMAQTTFQVFVVPETNHPDPNSHDEVYELDEVQGAELTLVRGETYIFQMNNVPGNHPFFISTSATGGDDGASEWTDGVTGNFAVANETLTFVVPIDAPDLLYYQCSIHEIMGWKINLVDPVDPVAISCSLNAANPPPLTIPAAGQTVFFDFDITNSTGGPYSAQFWLNTTGPVNLPEIGPISRLIGPGGISLTLRMKMTAAAPAGTWTRTCDIGETYPTSLSTSSFSFDKSSLFAPGDVIVNGLATQAEIAAEFEAALDAALDEQAALTAELPTTATLTGSYPNPFNPSTTIRFGLPETADVSLVVFDVMGREVARLVDGTVKAGLHEASFNASQLPSGMYFARFTAGSEVIQTHQLTLLK